MNEQIFKIYGVWHKKDKCFPDLNDLISEACRHPKAFGRYKHDYEQIVIDAVRQQLPRGWKTTKKVRMDILCAEPINTPHPRDEDNVISAIRKITQDALVRIQVIHDDKPQYLSCGFNKVIYTKGTPYVEVHIVEIG